MDSDAEFCEISNMYSARITHRYLDEYLLEGCYHKGTSLSQGHLTLPPPWRLTSSCACSAPRGGAALHALFPPYVSLCLLLCFPPFLFPVSAQAPKTYLSLRLDLTEFFFAKK